MKRKLVSFVAVIILMAGCNPASVSQSIASKTPILENPSPTETKTGFFTPIPEVIPSPNGIKYHCVDISNDAAKLSNMDGTLVLAGHLVPITTGKSFSNPSLLIDVSTGDQIVLIADDSTDRFVISPSGNLLAFDVWEGNSSNKWQINVLNSKGNILTKFVEEDLES